MAINNEITLLLNSQKNELAENGIKVPSARPFHSNFFNANSDEGLQDGEKIQLDSSTTGAGLASFYTADADVTPRANFSFSSKEVLPSYVMDEVLLTVDKYKGRFFGEAINGALSVEDRMNYAKAIESTLLYQSVLNRQEQNAITTLVDGIVTNPHTNKAGTTENVVVNWGRDSSLTAGTAGAWESSSFNISGQIESATDAMLIKGGAAPQFLIMGSDRWSAFRKNTSIEKHFNNDFNKNESLIIDPTYQSGFLYRGDIGGVKVFVYSDIYEDINKKGVRFFPNNTALLVGDVRGKSYYTTIQHVEHPQPEKVYAWEWSDERIGHGGIRVASNFLLGLEHINRTFKINC